ncbi:MAG: hypothetical protein JGK29_23785, partial [Microcoleus sp. PH2017_17_BER_D_A]|nr:hypothetical protein [Microcoleus sp. PH2017_17_BER_D_A]
DNHRVIEEPCEEKFSRTVLESGGSREGVADFNLLDGDELPLYNADRPATYQFSGKRVKRGLYRSKEGHLINADAQGAANIGRKSKQNGFTGLSRGCESPAVTNESLLRLDFLKNPRPFYGGECQKIVRMLKNVNIVSGVCRNFQRD